MPNPFEAPRREAAPADTLVEARTPSKTRKIIGGILIIVALMSWRGLQRPPGSSGNLVDDLPYLGGQLFVSAAIAVVGLFLLFKQPAGAAKRVR